MEACIKLIKHTLKKCFDNYAYTHLVLLQIRFTPLGSGEPTPVALIFNSPIRGIMPDMNWSPINADSDNDHYDALVERQTKADKNCDTFKYPSSMYEGSSVAVQ